MTALETEEVQYGQVRFSKAEEGPLGLFQYQGRVLHTKNIQGHLCTALERLKYPQFNPHSGFYSRFLINPLIGLFSYVLLKYWQGLLLRIVGPEIQGPVLPRKNRLYTVSVWTGAPFLSLCLCRPPKWI